MRGSYTIHVGPGGAGSMSPHPLGGSAIGPGDVMWTNVHIMSDEEATDWDEVERLRAEHPTWRNWSAGAGGSAMSHGPYTVRVWDGNGREVIANGPTQAKATLAALKAIASYSP